MKLLLPHWIAAIPLKYIKVLHLGYLHLSCSYSVDKTICNGYPTHLPTPTYLDK